MPNIAKVLREEITRLAKKESKLAITPVRKSTARIKPDMAALKNRLSVLEKEIKRLNVLAINLASTQPVPTVVEGTAGKAWITGKGVKSLRRKTGLSQKEFGKLTGVSPRAVVLWESKPGMLKLRDATKAAILSIRGIGKTEARKRLEEMGKAVKTVKASKPKGKKAGSKRRR